MLPENKKSHEYKTVVLIGGELHNIQVLVDKEEKVFEAVVSNPCSWETKLYKESSSNQYEFVLVE
jgi:hypothetical protein